MHRPVFPLEKFSNQGLITQGNVLHAHLIKTGFFITKIYAIKLLILAYVQWGNLVQARLLFDEMPERNEVSWSALISGLMKYGRVEESMWYFERNPFQNVVSWTAAISGFVRNGLNFEALKLFFRLLESGVRPNDVTFTSVVRACGELGDFGLGMSILGLVVKAGFEHYLSVSNSLITLSLRMGEIDLARRVFDRMEKRDVVSWTAILDAYSQSGYAEEALKLFSKMVQEGFKPNISCFACTLSALASLRALSAGQTPNKSTFSSVLCACASIASLDKGMNVHVSKQVFERMPEKNEISWTVMIQGLAESGFAVESLILFEEMERTSEVAPNELMLLSVLFACSHCGLVDKGLWYFNSMEKVYGIKPKALLSGCKKYKDEKIAERTAKKLWQLAENNSAGYVLLSNIYASAGRWIDVSNIRKLMREKGLKKSGGVQLGRGQWVDQFSNEVELITKLASKS
ncbi:Pentatricopeptide repeat-containing protein [Vitis vinifera]|uniref:Pentatricopeptide repeat-containing protein n=1 Tax=Vitis vinifera TaxID=29760 RepID=A0A438EFY4_VITVI|nr:Pentatricopeptide repeat-containing protein [Vitis vinifera]